MTEPVSTKTQPYCDFPKQSYSIMTDDFCHEKFLVLKPTLKTLRSTIKLKQTVNCKKGQCSVSDQLKLWFNLPKGGNLYTKFKSGDYVKIHYDDGVRLVQGKKVSLYAGVNTSRSLNLLAVKFGFTHDSEHCHSDSRLKITHGKEDSHNFYLYNRTMVFHNNFRFGLVTCFDICNKVLQKHNILLGYNFDLNTKGYLRAETNGFRTQNCCFSKPKQIFDKLTLNLVRTFNTTTTGGLEAVYNIPHNNLDNVKAVVQVVKPGNQIIKVGLNRYLDFSLVVKRPLSWFDDLTVVSAGTEIRGILKNQFDAKYGFEVAVNL